MMNKLLIKSTNVTRFRQQFKSDLDELLLLLKSDISGYYLISTDAYFVQDILRAQLKASRLNYTYRSISNILMEFAGSLGNYLREPSMNQTLNESDILIIDFTHYSELTSIDELIKEINYNRDLYNLRFQSVILLTRPELTYKIMTQALDFWTCVVKYIDTTSWWCSTAHLPLFGVRLKTNLTQALAETYKQDPDGYDHYLSIKKELEDKIQYTVEQYESFYTRIAGINDQLQHSLLLYSYIESLLFSQIPFDDCKKLLESITTEVLQNVLSNLQPELFCELALFYYRCGIFSSAEECYCLAYDKCLDMKVFGEQEISFLRCNINICHYLSGKLDASQLQDNILSILNPLIVNQSSFADIAAAYLLNLNACLEVPRYATYLDTYQKFKLLEDKGVDISSCGEYIWSSFAVTGTSTIPNMSEDFLDISDVSLYVNIRMYESIKAFANGEYEVSSQIYNKAYDIATKYKCLIMRELISEIHSNMIYIQQLLSDCSNL